MEIVAALAALAFVAVVIFVVLYLSVRVVQQYERMVVFRLGKTNEAMVREPGLRFLIPLVDRPVKVDMREQFIEVPSQTTITKDNAPINVDFLIYWRIADALYSVVNVNNFAGALQGVATTTLRAVIGDILLDDVLSKREQINEVLRVKLDEVTERWGGKITTVEIREITPPRDVQDAMNRQLSAERTRRAVITESEGARQSAINVAEGEKQSNILRAEGDRQAAILRAEGFSQALERIFVAASAVDSKTMALQYLEALKAIGASPSTKYVIPTEFTRFAEQIGGYVSDGLAKGAAVGQRRREVAGRPVVRQVVRRPPRAAARPPRDPARARRGRGAAHRRRRDPAADRRHGAAPHGRAPDGSGRGGDPGAARGARRGGRAHPGPRRRAAGRALAARRAGAGDDWTPDPREAVLLLHGWTGSVAPDLVEHAPYLRRDGERARARLPRARRLGRRPHDVRRARGRGRGRCAGVARASEASAGWR